jgi:hypothetical protein
VLIWKHKVYRTTYVTALLFLPSCDSSYGRSTAQRVAVTRCVCFVFYVLRDRKENSALCVPRNVSWKGFVLASSEVLFS